MISDEYSSYFENVLLSPGYQELPGGSDGKESTCNAGDPVSIPESGRFPGEGFDYPL